MMINPEGFIYPCLSIKIGNVKDKPIKELLTTLNTAVLGKILKLPEEHLARVNYAVKISY